MSKEEFQGPIVAPALATLAKELNRVLSSNSLCFISVHLYLINFEEVLIRLPIIQLTIYTFLSHIRMLVVKTHLEQRVCLDCSPQFCKFCMIVQRYKNLGR